MPRKGRFALVWLERLTPSTTRYSSAEQRLAVRAAGDARPFLDEAHLLARTVLLISACDPPRKMIATSSAPELVSVC